MVGAGVLLGVLLAVPQDTDTTFAVPRDARLDLSVLRGEVVVRTWNRNEVRVVADHSSATRIDIASAGTTVRVRARSRTGAADVDFALTVPQSMALELTGTFLDVDVFDTQGEVRVETVQGDVTVRGGRGRVSLKSVQGDVASTGARGRIEISSANGDVTMQDGEGEVRIETLNGEVVIDRVQATSVSATTVNGDVMYNGSFASGGRYGFTTHNGDITLLMGAEVSASVSVATFNGEFESDFPVTITETSSSGKRLKFMLGRGGAQIDLNSFGGTIALRRR